MSEEMPIWRQAIKDENHPLHRAAWMLFSKDFDVAYAGSRLEEQKEDVVGFCTLLLDARELYPSSALGGGNAPVNAVQLLCMWKVEAALPRLLQILDEESWDTVIYGTTADTIEAFGTTLVEPLLEMATRKTGDQEQVAIAGTLADAAPGDPRTVALSKSCSTAANKISRSSIWLKPYSRVIPKAGQSGCKIGYAPTNTVKMYAGKLRILSPMLTSKSFRTLANRLNFSRFLFGSLYGRIRV